MLVGVPMTEAQVAERDRRFTVLVVAVACCVVVAAALATGEVALERVRAVLRRAAGGVE